MRRFAAVIAVLLTLALLVSGCGAKKPASGDVTIRIATHWGEGFQEKLLPYLDEYKKLNPHVTFVYESVPFGDYLTKVQVSHASGDAPDIYHVYSLWGVQLADSKVIAQAPSNVEKYVKGEYTPAAAAGSTVNGKVYGIPTEINNYLLLYNKRLLAQAGFNAPPKTWDELYNMAAKITKKRPDGSIDQAGFAFMKGWDSAVVHPWMTIVQSHGGSFLSKDGKTTAINSPQAQKALEYQVRMVKEGITDPSLDLFQMFPAGKLGMVIWAPWWKDGLKNAMKDDFKDVGVAPIPLGDSGKPTSISYSWFWAVSDKSKNKEEAWKFLLWLNGQEDKNKGSRMGNYLTSIGIIPGRNADLTAYSDRLNDSFTKPFIDALPHTVAEPNIAQGQEIKTTLMREIEAAWFQKKSPTDALKAAETAINKIMKESQ